MSEPRNPRDHFDLTPQQYHGGLDKLWEALGCKGVQDKDVFSLAAEEITRLRGVIREIHDICQRQSPERDAVNSEIEEFWCLWFESTKRWAIIFSDLRVIGWFDSITEAREAAYRELERTQVEFVCTFDETLAYCFERDDKHWNRQDSD